MINCYRVSVCWGQCGDNVSDCPPPPEFHEPDTSWSWGTGGIFDDILKWASNALDFLGGLGTTIIVALVVLVLVILGVVKVVMDCNVGEEANPPSAQGLHNNRSFVPSPILVHASLGNIKCPPCCVSLGKGLYHGTCQCYRLVYSCLRHQVVGTVSEAVDVATGKPATDSIQTGVESHSDINVQRPASCDRMCRGAKAARKQFRRKMRLLKRKGITPPENAVWWQTKYQCTCVVR